MLRPFSVCLALCASSLAAGCDLLKPVGDDIGTYRVTMKLEENTCGPSAVHVQDGQMYKVQLRADGARGYWRLPGQPSIEGRYDDGEFQFGFNSVAVQSPEDAEIVCQILQDEVLTGRVDISDADAGVERDAGASADDDEALTGEHVLTLREAEGTDCSAALTSAGGGFEKLPCTVRYSLTGTPTKPF